MYQWKSTALFWKLPKRVLPRSIPEPFDPRQRSSLSQGTVPPRGTEVLERTQHVKSFGENWERFFSQETHSPCTWLKNRHTSNVFNRAWRQGYACILQKSPRIAWTSSLNTEWTLSVISSGAAHDFSSPHSLHYKESSRTGSLLPFHPSFCSGRAFKMKFPKTASFCLLEKWYLILALWDNSAIPLTQYTPKESSFLQNLAFPKYHLSTHWLLRPGWPNRELFTAQRSTQENSAVKLPSKTKIIFFPPSFLLNRTQML